MLGRLGEVLRRREQLDRALGASGEPRVLRREEQPLGTTFRYFGEPRGLRQSVRCGVVAGALARAQCGLLECIGSLPIPVDRRGREMPGPTIDIAWIGHDASQCAMRVPAGG